MNIALIIAQTTKNNKENLNNNYIGNWVFLIKVDI